MAKLRFSELARNTYCFRDHVPWRHDKRKRAGEHIYNYTIGDFDSTEFPIPDLLLEEIINSYKEGKPLILLLKGNWIIVSLYPIFIEAYQGVKYTPHPDIWGGRPLIYSAYRTVVDKGDKVIYPVPSWNNNHYIHFTQESMLLLKLPENNFMPTATDSTAHQRQRCWHCVLHWIQQALHSIRRNWAICDLIIEENASRKEGEKKLYLMFDQIYWTLTFGETRHYNPVALRPAMKDYTIFIDGISKALQLRVYVWAGPWLLLKWS